MEELYSIAAQNNLIRVEKNLYNAFTEIVTRTCVVDNEGIERLYLKIVDQFSIAAIGVLEECAKYFGETEKEEWENG